MKVCFLCVALALAVAAPAYGGTRATYRLVDEEKPLIVDVADNGDTSFEQVDGDMRIVVIGAHAYVVGTFEDGMIAASHGSIQAVGLLDVTQALKTTGTPVFELEEADRAAITAARTVIDNIQTTRSGSRMIAGVTGQVYRLSVGKDVTARGEDEFVATKAPEMQPIGRAFGIILTEGAGMVALFDGIGPEAARWLRVFTRLTELGAPLELRGLFELRSVETRRIPAETIALPGKPIAAEALIRRIRENLPGG